MKPTTNTTTISSFIYTVLLLSLIVDIGGSFGIRHAFTMIMVTWCIILVVRDGLSTSIILEIGLIFLFAVSAIYSLLRETPASSVYGALSFTVYILLIIALKNLPRQQIISLFSKAVLIASFVAIVTFLFILTHKDLAPAINAFGAKYQLGHLGLRPFGGETVPNVYYRWSMWLIPTVIIYFGRNNLAFASIGIALLVTSSTAILMSALLGIIFTLFLVKDRSLRSPKIITIIALTLALIFITLAINPEIYYSYIEDIFSKFSMSSGSTGKKLGHIQGVISAMQESTSNLVLGMGAGSEFYSPARGGYVVNIEPSHFNFARQFGLLAFIVFVSYGIYVCAGAFRTDAMGKRLSIGLLMLFIAAGTNPLLMSPIYIVYLMVVRAYTLRFYIEERLNA